MTITLTSPETASVGGSVVETDASAACTGINIDFIQQLITITLQNGTTSGQTFTPGKSLANPILLTISMATGAWQTNTGLSGTFNAASLASILSIFLGLRNQAEAFALQAAIIAGTAVPWAT